MELVIRGLVFFFFFSLFWYIAQTKNIFGLGAKTKSNQERVRNALQTSLIATVIYLILIRLTALY